MSASRTQKPPWRSARKSSLNVVTGCAAGSLRSSSEDPQRDPAQAHDVVVEVHVTASGGNGDVLDAEHEAIGIGTEANHLGFSAGVGVAEGGEDGAAVAVLNKQNAIALLAVDRQ
jgi:hypothetical protein